MSAVRVSAVRYAYPGRVPRSRGADARRGRGAAAAVPGVSTVAATVGVDGAREAALDGVSLELQAGTLTALLGPNGSGKSTLLRLIAGVDTPQAGTITLGTLRSGTPAAAMRLGVVFQSPSLDPRLTVRENLRCHAALHGLGAAASRGRIEVLMETAGLREHGDRLVRTLSGGLVRRADLARALLAEPEVLLLDEPTVGLDPSARSAFLDEVARVVRTHGVTVLLTTHLTDEADRADRVVLMHRGRIVADGPPAALRGELGPRLVAVETKTLPTVAEATRWRRRGTAWTIEPADEAETRSLLTELLDSAAPVTVAPPTLADLFERITGSGLAGERAEVGDE